MENCVTVIIAPALLHNFLVLQGNGYLEDPEVSSNDCEPDVDNADADNDEGQALVLDNSVQTALKEEFLHPRYNHFARRSERMAARAARHG